MTNPLNTLPPAALQLLSKQAAAAAKATRKALPVGEHALDCEVTLRLDGTVKVGEVYTQRIVAKADPWLLVAVALSKLNGVTVDAIVRESLDLSEDDATAIKDKAQEAIVDIKAATVKSCNGKVTTSKDSAVSVVSTAPARQAEVVIVSEEAA